MLSVTIPWDLTNALVKMDMREMEPTAQVSNKPRYQTMFLQLDGHTFPNALTSFSVEETSKDHFTVVI